MKWKANAKFNQPLESASAWTAKDTANVVIHKLHGLDDTLYLTCYDCEIYNRSLHTDDFEAAVRAAKMIIKDWLAVMQERYIPFINDSSETEIDRY